MGETLSQPPRCKQTNRRTQRPILGNKWSETQGDEKGRQRCENQWWDFKWTVEQRRRKTKAQRGWHSHQYYPIFRNKWSETHRDKGRQMNRIETKGAKAQERRTRPPILGNKLSETQADKRGATTNKINEQRRRETKTHTGWHSHQYSRMKWDAGRQKKTEAHQQPDREADSATNTRRQMNETEGDTGRQEGETFRWTETKGDKDLERHKCWGGKRRETLGARQGDTTATINTFRWVREKRGRQNSRPIFKMVYDGCTYGSLWHVLNAKCHLFGAISKTGQCPPVPYFPKMWFL